MTDTDSPTRTVQPPVDTARRLPGVDRARAHTEPPPPVRRTEQPALTDVLTDVLDDPDTDKDTVGALVSWERFAEPFRASDPESGGEQPLVVRGRHP